jgi:hypothetical protein
VAIDAMIDSSIQRLLEIVNLGGIFYLQSSDPVLNTESNHLHVVVRSIMNEDG